MSTTLTKAQQRLLNALASSHVPVPTDAFAQVGYSKRPTRAINALVAAKLIRDAAEGVSLTAMGRKLQAKLAAQTARQSAEV